MLGLSLKSIYSKKITNAAQQGDSPDRATFSFIATTPSRKNENIARPVICDVGPRKNYYNMYKILPLILFVITVYGEELTINKILNTTDVYSFCDGSSIYSFRKNGIFESFPLGIGGRAIDGKWEINDRKQYKIVGHWGWWNGKSIPSDKRELIIDIRPTLEINKLYKSENNLIIYNCYFTIESLSKFESAQQRDTPELTSPAP